MRCAVLASFLLWLSTAPRLSRASQDILQPGTPSSVGLLPEPLRELERNLSGYMRPANWSSFSYDAIHPIQPGAACIIGRHGTIVSEFAQGHALLYADVNGTRLPPAQQLPATVDTLYDLASLTKLFTSVAAMQQLDAGALALNATVASYVPAFAANGKANVTVLMLLTHTSGFAPDPAPPLYNTTAYATVAQRERAVLAQPLAQAPGSAYTYSDVNFMALGLVLERVAGAPLDALVRRVTRALALPATGFNRGNAPRPPRWRRTAATEFQGPWLGAFEPARPQPVRGTVHDENAFALGGVSGHAGLFATVRDVAVLCQMILNNGTYGGVRVLRPETVDLIFHNFNARFAGHAHGLGWELDQYYWAGPMAGPATAGHTGYTGTSVVIDRASGMFWVLFANRVHPSREWSSNNIARETVGYWVARALGRDVAFPAI